MTDFRRAMEERDRRRQNRKDFIELLAFMALCGFIFWALPKLLNGELF